MLKNKTIRLATEDDCESVLKIYAPYITNTAVTFEYKIPTIAEFKERMADIQKYYPWLVCEIDNKIAGYAYASRFGEREAYKWSVDFSVYIDPEHHGKNIGKALYSALSGIIKLQGFYNAYALVSVPNIKSENLHESFGFKAIGVYRNVGYKHGKWRDIKVYELKIQEHVQSPADPLPIDKISDTDELRAIIEKAEQMIRTG
ncbi:MAG: GNAT family N-acetyltransferase [Acetivibrionales bacterium]|jgi:L-amino acid N-acyltransferase YncA